FHAPRLPVDRPPDCGLLVHFVQGGDGAGGIKPARSGRVIMAGGGSRSGRCAPGHNDRTMVYLMVRFHVALHETALYERIFAEEFLPLLREHGFRMVGTFRTLVGTAGEYHEIWGFADLAEFQARWIALFSDPRTVEVVRRTGPLVRGEVSRILTAAPFSPEP